MANRDNPKDILQTVLTAAGAGIKLDEGTQELVKKLLAKQLATLEQVEAADEAHVRASLAQAKAIEHQKARLRTGCAHMKTPTRTALQGQRLQNGQTVLVCCRCGTMFHTDPIKQENQYAPPARLMPSRGIGGAEEINYAL